MISDILIGSPWLTTLALLALVAGGPPLAWWLSARPRLAWLLAGLGLIPVMIATLIPAGGMGPSGCAVQWSAPSLGAVELIGNLVLFVPPVFAAAVASRRVLLVALAGSALSALIEVAQLLLPALGRSCDTNDWLYNTLGSLLGAALAGAGLLLARRLDRRARALR